MLNHFLDEQAGQQLDIATAYFSIRGFQQVRHTLPRIRHFRLLSGDEPKTVEQVGLRPDSAAFLRRDDVEIRLYPGHCPDESGRRKIRRSGVCSDFGIS